MLSVVCWKWRPAKDYRSKFGPETVNVLCQMVARHYPHPHRFLCVTDEPEGLSPEVEVIPAWNDFADLPSPHGKRNPSCYRRLRAFHPAIGAVFGARFVSLDLDCVIVGDLTPLWQRPEEFVIWGDTNRRTYYNGSMFLLTAGSRPKVWTAFDPKTSPALALRARQFGSDQAWISCVLGKGQAKWTAADGVYSYRNEIMRRQNALPENARIVFFHGPGDPWGVKEQRIPWVRQEWRSAVIAQEAIP
jgi:hypothetical protein